MTFLQNAQRFIDLPPVFDKLCAVTQYLNMKIPIEATEDINVAFGLLLTDRSPESITECIRRLQNASTKIAASIRVAAPAPSDTPETDAAYFAPGATIYSLAAVSKKLERQRNTLLTALRKILNTTIDELSADDGRLLIIDAIARSAIASLTAAEPATDTAAAATRYYRSEIIGSTTFWKVPATGPVLHSGFDGPWTTCTCEQKDFVKLPVWVVECTREEAGE